MKIGKKMQGNRRRTYGKAKFENEYRKGEKWVKEMIEKERF